MHRDLTEVRPVGERGLVGGEARGTRELAAAGARHREARNLGVGHRTLAPLDRGREDEREILFRLAQHLGRRLQDPLLHPLRGVERRVAGEERAARRVGAVVVGGDVGVGHDQRDVLHSCAETFGHQLDDEGVEPGAEVRPAAQQHERAVAEQVHGGVGGVDAGEPRGLLNDRQPLADSHVRIVAGRFLAPLDHRRSLVDGRPEAAARYRLRRALAPFAQTTQDLQRHPLAHAVLLDEGQMIHARVRRPAPRRPAAARTSLAARRSPDTRRTAGCWSSRWSRRSARSRTRRSGRLLEHAFIGTVRACAP